jgi:hypothetical protein
MQCPRTLSSIRFSAVLSLGFVGSTGCNLLPIRSEKVAKFDSCVASEAAVRELKLDMDSETEARVSATLLGIVALGDTAQKLDEHVANLCLGISRELGAEKPEGASTPEAGTHAQAACNTAIETVAAEKQKAEANLSVEMKEQRCSPLLDDFGACAKDCDPNVSATPGAGISCEAGKLSGRCAATCTGTCTESFTDSCKSTCQGKCAGKCTQGFFGKCSGKCIGTCDMATISGKCDGNCDGKCLSGASGTCEGTCEGKCQGSCVTEIKKKACDGTCAGACSDKMTSGRCDDIVVPPELSPECSAMCAAKTASSLACTGGFVEVAVFSAKNKSRAESIRAAVAGRLKDVLNVGDGMQPPLERAQQSVKGALDGLDQTASEDPKFGEALGDCLKAAREKHESASAAFAKLHELGQALYQAVRN